MSAALIQFVGAEANSAGTTIAVTITATAGSFIFLGTSNVGSVSPASTISSISDGTNTWNLLGEDDINGFRSRSAWASNSVTGSLTITVTYANSANSNRQIGVMEFSGCSAFQVAHDQQQIGPGSGTDAVTSGNATPTSQPAMVAGFTWDVTGITVEPSVGTGFTLGGRIGVGSGSLKTLAFEYQRITSTSAIAAKFTNSGGDTFFITHMAVFTETAAAATGATAQFFGMGA